MGKIGRFFRRFSLRKTKRMAARAEGLEAAAAKRKRQADANAAKANALRSQLGIMARLRGGKAPTSRKAMATTVGPSPQASAAAKALAGMGQPNAGKPAAEKPAKAEPRPAAKSLRKGLSARDVPAFASFLERQTTINSSQISDELRRMGIDPTKTMQFLEKQAIAGKTPAEMAQFLRHKAAEPK